MAMLTGGADSGVETENESNDLDIINVNILNERGDPILDLPDSGPSSSESDLNQQLGAVGSSLLGPDGGPSILLGLKDKGDEPPPPPPPTSPNICGTGEGVPEFLDVAPVHNFLSDSLDGMIEETEDDGLTGTANQVQREVNMEAVLSSSSSHPQSMPGIEDEIMERDDTSDDDEKDIRKVEVSGYESVNGEYSSPSKRFLHDIPERDFTGCGNLDEELEYKRRYTFSFSSTVDLSFGGGGENSNNAFSYSRPRAMSDSFHHASNVYHPPPAPPVTPTNVNVNNCRALVKFEFPELPKLVPQFEPPAGLQSFTSIQPFHNDSHGGYSILNSAPSASDCRALIPYEQKDLNPKARTKSLSGKATKNTLYDNWTNIRKERNEKRLRTAAGAGSFTMVQKLLTVADMDPNAPDELGRTALHVAACKGFSDIVSLLITSGANPNARDCVGNTPLHLAACTNHFDVVTCLLRAGTDVSTLDNNGRNPLQLAQSKLKLLANWKSESDDALKIKNEVRQIVEMILEYLQKKGKDMEAELLNDFASRLTLSQTPEEVDADVKSLLANLSSLTINVGSTHATSSPITIPPKNPYLIPTFNLNLAKPRTLGHSPTSLTLPSGSSPGGSASGSAVGRSVIGPAHFSLSSSPSPTPHEEQKQLISNLNRRRIESEKSLEHC